jgi:hypothetical protein
MCIRSGMLGRNRGLWTLTAPSALRVVWKSGGFWRAVSAQRCRDEKGMAQCTSTWLAAGDMMGWSSLQVVFCSVCSMCVHPIGIRSSSIEQRMCWGHLVSEGVV